jgi:hypothetical protein
VGGVRLMTSPAEPGYGLFKVFQDIEAVQAAVKRLEQTPPPVYVDRAVVFSYTSGPQCVIQDASGGLRTAAFLTGYTPVAGDVVEVFNLPGRVFILKPSA